MTKNAYPEKPEIAYKQTKVQMPDIVIYLRSLQVEAAIKIAAYVMFRMESANGTKGVNNNYCGIQADGNRWPQQWDDNIIATCLIKENKTFKERRFVCFDSWKTSIDMLVDRVKARGLHVGGFAHKIYKRQINTPDEWVTAYYREWVTGNPAAIPSQLMKDNLLSMYNQGVRIY